MNTRNQHADEVDDKLNALGEQIVSLAGLVELVFADAIVALVEGDVGATQEVRLEDYKAHKVWLETDSLCIDLVATGQLRLQEVKFVTGAIKIAMGLKLMADEAARISRHMSACPDGGLPSGPWAQILPRMADIAQSMLSTTVEALVSRDGSETQGLHLVARELSTLNERLLELANEKMGAPGALPAEVGTALVLVARSLEQIGQRALDVANQVAHVYPSRRAAEEQEPEGQ